MACCLEEEKGMRECVLQVIKGMACLNGEEAILKGVGDSEAKKRPGREKTRREGNGDRR
jgi:hypothetical protein